MMFYVKIYHEEREVRDSNLVTLAFYGFTVNEMIENHTKSKKKMEKNVWVTQKYR